MKNIGFVTDTHLGARASSDIMREYFKWFWCDFFFPKMKENNVSDILHGGDFFDNRININAKDIDFLINVFIPTVNKYKINFHIILGNHDIHYKNTNDVSIADIFKNCNYIKIYNEPKKVKLNNLNVLLVPWINKENYDKSLNIINSINNGTAGVDICLGHFEIEGFKMYRTSISSSGLNPKLFDKIPWVFSGHYHHASKIGNIRYLGSPFHLNWQDYPDERGIYVLKDNKLEFIKNPTTLFNEIEYNNQDFTDNEIKSLEGQFIKIIVNNRDDNSKYLNFLKKIKKIKTHSLEVIDKTLIKINNIKKNNVSIDNHDNLSIINKYYDNNINDELIRNKIKKVAQRVYNESLNSLIRGE